MSPLSDDDRALALRRFDAVAARPHAVDLAPIGCFTWIVAAALLLVAPKLPLSWKVPLMTLAGLLVVLGVALRFFGPGRRAAQAGARAREAIDALATLDYAADRERWFELASVALCDAFYSGGPYTLHTYDFDEARDGLGPALPRMIAFETLVRLERSAYPVFTDFTSPTA